MDPFKRMTDRSRRVLGLGARIARHLGHAAVDPEHLLLALADEGHGVAAHVLQNLGADRLALRQEFDARIPPGLHRSVRTVPLAEATERILDRALDEARRLNHNYIGTEHLVIALTAMCEGVCLQMLDALDVTAVGVRDETYSILGHNV
jgi:ATP-dependent Clp protease ATP-binding subunit ClpC